MTKAKARTLILLGSGALKIGEAGEFDYSGSQAIKAFKEEGYRVVLVNPNIATVQTNTGFADEVYFVPVQPAVVSQIIAKEKPQAISLSFGGQTALNCGMELYRSKILDQFEVAVLGTPVASIIATEDRQLFSQSLKDIGLKTAAGQSVLSVKEGVAVAHSIGYPVMVRAGFALGGSGSGVARSQSELEQRLQHIFAVSSQAVVEECLLGWKEVEYEVVRDLLGNSMTVCNMENLDPVGIHTGESIVVAPSQTLTNTEYYHLRQVSLEAIRHFNIIGECNIQYALHPTSSDYRIIEVNARLSRSSALASKATGYPLAYVAAKLASGKTLPELHNAVTGKTSAYFEPALDYVVVKMPRWDLSKFTTVDTDISSEMKSVGEVMSIGRSFPEALQKAARMLNDGYVGVVDRRFSPKPEDKLILLKRLKQADSLRLFTICALLQLGVSVKVVHDKTGIDLWFLTQINTIIDTLFVLQRTWKLSRNAVLRAKKDGFSDRQIADICGLNEEHVRRQRLRWGITPYVKQIDTMAGEFPAVTSYLYCTYHAEQHDIIPISGKKVIVLGSGPYAIGSSVEFDWSAVTTVRTLRQSGYAPIIINCNPETVSTDFDESQALYFEELSLERVRDIYEFEHAPLITSVSGQVGNSLTPQLAKLQIPLLGTPAASINCAESREAFSTLLDSLHIDQPAWKEVKNIEAAARFAKKVGYPILARPSFVLSGQAMSLLHSEAELRFYFDQTHIKSVVHPIVISKFITQATECDFDGVAQSGKLLAWVISEHVESGGTHSGDSSMVLPPMTLSTQVQAKILHIAQQLAASLQISGPVNIQFLIHDDQVSVIECNLRASRSVPFVSKATGVNLIEMSTRIALGRQVAQVKMPKLPYFVVKVPQFSFNKLRGADPVLQIEMNSTGEAAAFGLQPNEAFLKSMLSTGISYPSVKAILISLGGVEAKILLLSACRKLHQAGYVLFATSGTALFLKENEIPVKTVAKLSEGKSDIATMMQKKQIDFAIIVPDKRLASERKRQQLKTDGYVLRRLAVDSGVTIFTNTETANFFVSAICNLTFAQLSIKPWSYYQTLLARYRSKTHT